MAAIVHPSPDKSDTLLVFLPGVKDRARVFDDQGFVAQVRDHGVRADVLLADAHSGYYIDGTFLRRLHLDILTPARRRQYRRIILIGVSMGAYGALRYAITYPHELAEIVLVAPFLGAGPFDKKLADAGDEDFSLTRGWIDKYPAAATEEERANAGYPRIVLAFGSGDLFAKSDREIAAQLPAEDVVTTGGLHDWGTWKKLFAALLDRQLVH